MQRFAAVRVRASNGMLDGRPGNGASRAGSPVPTVGAPGVYSAPVVSVSRPGGGGARLASVPSAAPNGFTGSSAPLSVDRPAGGGGSRMGSSATTNAAGSSSAFVERPGGGGGSRSPLFSSAAPTDLPPAVATALPERPGGGGRDVGFGGGSGGNEGGNGGGGGGGGSGGGSGAGDDGSGPSLPVIAGAWVASCAAAYVAHNTLIRPGKAAAAPKPCCAGKGK